jgi:hypothetical protein
VVVTTLSDQESWALGELADAACRRLDHLIATSDNPETEVPKLEARQALIVAAGKAVRRNARPRTTEQQKRGEVVFDNAVWRQVHQTGRTATEDAEELVRQFNAAHPELAEVRDNILEASA